MSRNKRVAPKTLEGVFSLRGQIWRLLRTGKRLDAEDDGSCARDSHTLRVRPRLRARRELEVLIHEALHACFDDLDEEAVRSSALDISKMLRKLGYRRVTRKR